METLETILIFALLSVWFLISIGFLVSIIQEVINDNRREKREAKTAERDRKYHEARMHLTAEEIENLHEYHEKRMKQLDK